MGQSGDNYDKKIRTWNGDGVNSKDKDFIEYNGHAWSKRKFWLVL